MPGRMVDWRMGVSRLRYTYFQFFLNGDEWLLVESCRPLPLTHWLWLSALPSWVEVCTWLRHYVESTSKRRHRWATVASKQDDCCLDSDNNFCVRSFFFCSSFLPHRHHQDIHVELHSEPFIFCVCERCWGFVSHPRRQLRLSPSCLRRRVFKRVGDGPQTDERAGRCRWTDPRRCIYRSLDCLNFNLYTFKAYMMPKRKL